MLTKRSIKEQAKFKRTVKANSGQAHSVGANQCGQIGRLGQTVPPRSLSSGKEEPGLKVCRLLSAKFDIDIWETENPSRRRTAWTRCGFLSAVLKTVAVSLRMATGLSPQIGYDSQQLADNLVDRRGVFAVQTVPVDQQLGMCP